MFIAMVTTTHTLCEIVPSHYFLSHKRLLEQWSLLSAISLLVVKMMMIEIWMRLACIIAKK